MHWIVTAIVSEHRRYSRAELNGTLIWSLSRTPYPFASLEEARRDRKSAKVELTRPELAVILRVRTAADLKAERLALRAALRGLIGFTTHAGGCKKLSRLFAEGTAECTCGHDGVVRRARADLARVTAERDAALNGLEQFRESRLEAEQERDALQKSVNPDNGRQIGCGICGQMMSNACTHISTVIADKDEAIELGIETWKRWCGEARNRAEKAEQERDARQAVCEAALAYQEAFRQPSTDEGHGENVRHHFRRLFDALDALSPKDPT